MATGTQRKDFQAFYQEVIKGAKKKEFEPIYFLHGEEPFFIDAITDALIEHAIEPSMKAFNQSIYYGKECNDAITLMTEAQSYPMIGDKRLIIIKEAQEFKHLEAFEPYFARPMNQTILVIAYKYKAFDSRKKLLKLALQNGVVFLSEKVRDYKIVDWIVRYAKNEGYTIAPKAAVLLGESLGTDLSRIANELKKLSILVPKGTKINENHIEENIGISKDYNFFELQNAFSEGDFLKASKIIHYFEKNPKMGPITPIISLLYNYHSRLLKIAFSKSKTDKELIDESKINPFLLPQYKKTIRYYNKKKIALNIEILLEYELKSKGIMNASASGSDLMKEMMFRLMQPLNQLKK